MRPKPRADDAVADELRSARQFAALGNPLRLACLRFVIAAGSTGRAAGDIARALGVGPSTLSSHLAVLQQCGLLVSRRDRQRVIYSVNCGALRALVAYLVEDCCHGHPELCGLPRP